MADGQEAGTTVDGSAQTPGTTADGTSTDSDIAAKLERLNQLERAQEQWLGEKNDYEALKREKSQGGFQAQQPPTANGHEDNAEMQLAYLELQQEAALGNRQAKLQLASINETFRLRAENQELREEIAVPDDRRERVKEIAKREGVTLRVADMIYDGLDSRESKKRVAELEQTVIQSKPKPVTTAVAGVPATEVLAGNVIRRADWGTHLAKIRSEQGDAAASAEVRKKDAGQIRLAD